jgi:CRISPR-associated protein Csm2
MSHFDRSNQNQHLNRSDLVKSIITSGFNSETLDYAHQVGSYIARSKVTTSQIRNVYGELVRIKMASEKQFQLHDILMLKPKMAYAVGRDKSQSKDGLRVLQRNLDDAIDTISKAESTVQPQYFKHFASFFEAILAYHKAEGGS